MVLGHTVHKGAATGTPAVSRHPESVQYCQVPCDLSLPGLKQATVLEQMERLVPLQVWLP